MKLKDYIKKVWQRTRPSKRTEELLDWLVAQGIIDGSDYCTTYDGDIHYTEDTFECDRCGDCHSTDDSRTVIVGPRLLRVRRGNEETWCDCCTDNGTFFCDHSDHYFHDSNFSSVQVDGYTVCFEWNQDNLYYWESDGDYHWDPEDEDEDEDKDDLTEALQDTVAKQSLAIRDLMNEADRLREVINAQEKIIALLKKQQEV